ncbi:hypothetical protein L1987_68355 [Smallanthus sonchifolius]|uniref:Uncharacterized protein n=1 Tax=Smallanthus sonchifolius TaxID=185202 RepID=A0ACB9B8M1_9ASTR|nr:hypothetical protein L1987_68355 [Smallanthus sonchifolius]
MSSANSPCAACKFLRRKCAHECLFAPCFPPDQPQKFANVHKVFGASNVVKILNELDTHQQEDAVNWLAYEADARLRDPVYGCAGLISVLQHRLKQVQKDLDIAKMELASYLGPSAMLPVLNQGFTPLIPDMASSLAPVLPYNTQPVIGVAGNFQHCQHQRHTQILDTQQQQQQQQQPVDIVRHVIGGGFNPMTAPAAMTPCLSLGSAYVNNMYQIQQPETQQEQKPYLQPHQFLLQQETHQSSPAIQIQRTVGEVHRSIAPSC